MAPYKKNGQLD